MLLLKIKPCMSEYEVTVSLNLRTAPQTSCNTLHVPPLSGAPRGAGHWHLNTSWISLVILGLIHDTNTELRRCTVGPVKRLSQTAVSGGGTCETQTNEAWVYPFARWAHVLTCTPFTGHQALFWWRLAPFRACFLPSGRECALGRSHVGSFWWRRPGQVCATASDLSTRMRCNGLQWSQRVQRIRVRSWRVGLRDCSYF